MMANEILNPVSSASLDVRAIPASATSKLILSASEHRAGAVFYNHSPASLYLRYSQNMDYSASVDLFTVKLASGSYFEMLNPVYRGQVHGIWDDADGVVMVTNLDVMDPYR